MSVEVSDETKQVLEWVRTEVNAGKCLVAVTPVERQHNGATERAISIIEKYARGEGLFQVADAVDKRKAAEASA